MASIPTLQNRNIPRTTSKVSHANVTGSAINLVDTMVQIASQYKKARDTTKVNEEYAKFQVDMQTSYNDLRNTANPETFSDDWNKLYDEKKKQYLDNPSLSGKAKSTLETILNRYQASNIDNVYRTQRELQISDYATNIENTAQTNNLFAYRAGKNLDLNSLQEAEKIIDGNIIAGSTLVAQDKLNESRNIQTQNVYSKWFEGAIEKNPYQSLELLNSKEYDEKLGVDNIQRLAGLAKSNIKELEKEREKKNKKFTDILRTTSALNGDIFLDPKTTDDVKSVDTFWEYISNEHNRTNTTFEDRIADAKMISERTGIIPSQVQTVTSALLFNGDSNQQVMVAQFITDITNNKPRVAEQYDSNTRAFAETINQNLNAGVDQNRAVSWARQTIDQNKKQERELRIKNYSQGKENIKAIQNDIEKMKSSLIPFFGDIEVGERIQSDFATLQQNYFVNEHVDRKTAYELAKKDILNTYAITDIGKKRFMKYAPEKYYGQQVEEIYGIKPDWIKKQVINTVKKDKLFATEKEFQNYIDNISLEVNPDSVLGGKNPTYYIFTTDEDGINILMDNNMPVEYIPNFSQTEEYKKLREQVKEIGTPEEITQKIQDIRSKERFKRKFFSETFTGGLIGY